jgi:hypothetical protein
MGRKLLVLTVLALAALAAAALGDVVELKNGRKFRGKVIRRTDDDVTLQLPNGGELTFSTRQVAKILTDEEERQKLLDEARKQKPQDQAEEQQKPPARVEDQASEKLEAQVKGLKAWAGEGLTGVELEIKAEEGRILGIDREKTWFTEIKDDTGRELGSKTQDEEGTAAIDEVEEKEPGKRFVVKLHTRKEPGPGADIVSLKGGIQLWYATEKEDGLVRNVELVKGSEFEIGKLKVRIAKVTTEENKWGQGLSLELSVTPCVPFIPQCLAGTEFLDLKGRKVGSEMKSHWCMLSDKGIPTYTIIWSLWDVVPVVDIKYTFWKAPQRRHVELSTTATLERAREQEPSSGSGNKQDNPGQTPRQ